MSVRLGMEVKLCRNTGDFAVSLWKKMSNVKNVSFLNDSRAPRLAVKRVSFKKERSVGVVKTRSGTKGTLPHKDLTRCG